MKITKIIAIILCLTLCMSLFAGCDKAPDPTESTPSTSGTTAPTTQPTEPEPADPIDAIKNSYFTYAFFADGVGDMVYYVHFYDEAPVLGSVFFIGYANCGITYTGTYTVEETPCDYVCYAQRGDETPVTGTAPYTVTFYDWEGNVLDSCGYDGEVLYNDMEVLAGAYNGPNYYYRETDVEGSKYADYYAGEPGVKYLDFIAEDPTCTLSLYHNGTYMDLMGMIVEGTWEIASNDENGLVINLKPEYDTDTPATVTVSADRATAVYTPKGGAAVNLTNTAAAAPEVSVVFTFAGEVPVPGMEGVNAPATLSVYDDGTCVLNLDIFGTVMELDAGTWTMGADGMSLVFTFGIAGEITSVLDMTTFAVTVPYVATGTIAGDVDVVLNMVTE